MKINLQNEYTTFTLITRKVKIMFDINKLSNNRRAGGGWGGEGVRQMGFYGLQMFSLHP